MRLYINSLLCALVLMLGISPIQAVSYRIKSYNPDGNTTWGFQSGTYTSAYRNSLLNSANFGPSGIVKDVQFTSILDVSAITTANLADADIFILMFPYGAGWSMNSTEAQILKNFVDQGKSLFVSTDFDTRYANLIGDLFGGVNCGGVASTHGSVSITNRTIAPELTNGPFGIVNTLSWSSNGTPMITAAGNSTIIDSWGMVSVITPTTTSGSVIFYADTGLFVDFGISYTGQWSYLGLNAFSYAAHSTTLANVPEPGTLCLLVLGLLTIFQRKFYRS